MHVWIRIVDNIVYDFEVLYNHGWFGWKCVNVRIESYFYFSCEISRIINYIILLLLLLLLNSYKF